VQETGVKIQIESASADSKGRALPPALATLRLFVLSEGETGSQAGLWASSGWPA
jgi:hypothetical protein